MVEELEIRQTHRLEPVGECIYCGSTENLSDEHIVPLALGGRIILPKASCAACAVVTSGVERQVLRGFMRDARAVGKFPTRRPKERLRTSSLDIKRGGHFESIELPSAESPGFLHLPRFARAAFLAGCPPMKGVTVVGSDILYFGRNPQEVARTIGTKTIRTTVTVDASSFARMLAKIGYSYAVASQGLYPRTEVPMLPMILGSVDDGGTWVGSAEYQLPVEAKRPTHALGLDLLTAVVDGVAEKILIAKVKLFADAGARGFEVVVRRARP